MATEFTPRSILYVISAIILLLISLFAFSQPGPGDGKTNVATIFGCLLVAGSCLTILSFVLGYRKYIFGSNSLQVNNFWGATKTEVMYVEIEKVLYRAKDGIRQTGSTGIQVEYGEEDMVIVMKDGNNTLLNISDIDESREMIALLRSKINAGE